MYLSEIIKALGDDTRLRMLHLLSKRELCVCQIIEVLRLSQPNASKHLNKLKYAGIIRCRKIAQWCFYQTDSRFTDKYPLLYQFLVEQWNANDSFKHDADKLQDTIGRFDCCKAMLQKYSDHKQSSPP